MARSDLLLSLVRAANEGDRALVRRTVETIAAEERAKQHSVLADQLLDAIRGNGSRPLTTSEPAEIALTQSSTSRTLEEIVLPPRTRSLVADLIEEQHRSDLLHSHGLAPRHRLLLTGPPGNGKTSLANAIATNLAIPMFTVNYDRLIGSYLGETASALGHLFDYVRSRRCVVFFDEFDTLAKERGDVHETGEIKRVVSSLLLQIDALPPYVVVIVATNHEELLDRAVWRRFEVSLHLPPPTPTQVKIWLDAFKDEVGPLGHSSASIAERLLPSSFSDLELFCLNVMRRTVLSQGGKVSAAVTTELRYWQRRKKTR